MKKIGLIFAGLLSMAVQPAIADVLGLANGRSANNDNLSGLSVEGGLSLGSDFTVFAARVNYKVTPDLMVFGDLGNVDIDLADSGFGFGIGAFYQMRNVQLLENTDFGLKASYHSVSVDFDDFFGSASYDVTEIAFDALISGDQLSTTDFGWYANAGVHILGVDFGSFGSDDETNIAFGGGVTGALGFGEWYAGADFIDGMILRAGVRYNLN